MAEIECKNLSNLPANLEFAIGMPEDCSAVLDVKGRNDFDINDQ